MEALTGRGNIAAVAASRLENLGRFELLVELGGDALAQLYVALGRFDEYDWRPLVTIKRIRPHLAADVKFGELFRALHARLNHQHIRQVFDLGRDGDECFVIMEYLRGVSWDVLAAATPPGSESLRLAAAVLSHACEGLHHAHTIDRTPIIHGAVSPQNLFVTADGVAKLLDFGVSRMLETLTGIPDEPGDPRSDVSALGVVLWEALAKERLAADAEVPSLAARGYPPAIDDLIRHALARDRRCASAHAFGVALRAATGRGLLGTQAVAEAVMARCGTRIAAHDAIVVHALDLRRAVTK